jgi:hypothetical protein
MKECANCGFHNDGACVCPQYDKWYACPIENKKPENVQALKEYAEQDEWKRESVEALDKFTKAFCRDKQVSDDLVFRCDYCKFGLDDGMCLVKIMARNICPNYKEFGSMGDL